MKKKHKVSLSASEIEELESIIRRGIYPATKLKRAYALPGADEAVAEKAMTDEEISHAYHMRVRTVEKLRKRLVEEGFQVALHGKQRKARCDIKMDGAVEAYVIAVSRTTPPAGRNRWTLMLIAEKVVKAGLVESISHTAVANILKKRYEALRFPAGTK